MGKAFVLHSGGIDSTTCLYIAVNQFGYDNVVSVSMDYGQRHHKEIEAARLICNTLGVRHRTAKMGEQVPSMLTDKDISIPKIDYSDIKGISPTYVPFRNGQLLSYLAGLVQGEMKEEGDNVIFFGAHAEDAANWAYPDCTPEFIGAMANAIFVGTYQRVRLHTPIMWMNKQEIIQLGDALGVQFEMTWSCYEGGEYHCGTCPTCRARRKGFAAANVTDLTIYGAL